jgi:leader peptidase (prepilin peptidase)/N-methyltransferase
MMMDLGGEDPLIASCRDKSKANFLAKLGRGIATQTLPAMALVIGIAGAAAIVSIALAPGAIGLLGAGLAVVAIGIAVIDLRHYVIPDGLNVAGFLLAIGHAAALDVDAMLTAMAMAAVRGMVVALLFFILRQLYVLIRGRVGLGLGDVKLAGVAGAWLEWSTIPVAIEIATLTALSTFLLRQHLLRRPIAATSRLPFGFFLAPAIWLGWVLQLTWLAPVY